MTRIVNLDDGCRASSSSGRPAELDPFPSFEQWNVVLGSCHS
jgi:hypothetical protein